MTRADRTILDQSSRTGRSITSERSSTGSLSVDLHTLIAALEGQGAIWSHVGEDLNVNLVVWPEGAGVAAHRNHEVEVLLVGLEGEGSVLIDGSQTELRPGTVVIIPKGTERAISSRSTRLAYLSVHRRRAPLQPTALPPRHE